MAADVDIFPTEGNLRAPLIGSVTLHVALFALGIVRLSDSQQSRRELGRHRAEAAAR